MRLRRYRSPYRLLGWVGSGQFGRVDCAIDRRSGQLVALKTLQRDRCSTTKFLRELRFVLSLEHPRIATCHALAHGPTGQRQLVLDYCEGGTLRVLLESAMPLSLQERLAIVGEILQALMAAHHQRIVHCDIKPENVLLSIVPGGWQVKIADFGIARLSHEAATAESNFSGSPAYMAPERFYHQHSPAADLYAVGIILYELLVGQRPFSGTPVTLMQAHLNQRLVLPKAIPDPVGRVIAKALQKLPARRYRTAAEMLHALQLAATQLPAAQIKAIPQRCCRWEPGPTLPPPRELPCALTGVSLVPFPADAPVGSESSAYRLLVVNGQALTAIAGPPDMSLQQQWQLAEPLRAVVPVPYGSYLVSDRALQLLLPFEDPLWVAPLLPAAAVAIAPSGRWLASCPRQLASTQLQLQRLIWRPGQPLQLTALPPINVAGRVVDLVAIDLHHLLLVTEQSGQTQLQCFTRRGQALGQLTLATALRSLVPSDRPYRFLAQEAGFPKALIAIDLKPFRVSRYRLDIEPRWLMATALGYVVISASGRLQLLSQTGQLLAQLEGLPQPTDVVLMSPTKLLWAVSAAQHSSLYTVDLSKIGQSTAYETAS